MTEKDYLKIVDAIEDAGESDRPYLVHEEEPIIVGDANDTQVNKTDFKVKFRLPKKEDGKITYEHKEIEYNDVFITPRMDMKIVRAVGELTPFFRKVNEDGEIENFSPEEAGEIVESLSDEIIDHLYDLVGSVLNINPSLRPYMTVASVFENTAAIIRAFPEAYNEGEAFFPSLSAEETTTRQ